MKKVRKLCLYTSTPEVQFQEQCRAYAMPLKSGHSCPANHMQKNLLRTQENLYAAGLASKARAVLRSVVVPIAQVCICTGDPRMLNTSASVYSPFTFDSKEAKLGNLLQAFHPGIGHGVGQPCRS